MSDLLSLNLIRFLNFYLTVMALASLYRRSQQYQMIGSLAMSGPSRWPRLIELIRQHYSIFMTWGTIRPVLAAGVLLLANFIASRFIWPTATLTLGDLLTEWYYMPVVVITGLAMLTMDCYSLIVVNTLNRDELEKHLDYAEHWLTTWKAPIIRFVTLGYVDPRRMVDERGAQGAGGNQPLGQQVVVVDGRAGRVAGGVRVVAVDRLGHSADVAGVGIQQ
jgi:hypothetical protein